MMNRALWHAKKKRKESLLPEGIANPKIRSYKHKDLQTGLFLLGTRYQSHRFIQAKQGKKLSATAPCASIRCCCFISTLSKAIASCHSKLTMLHKLASDM